MTTLRETPYQRQRIIVQGIVQGVGFRPFVYGQAMRRKLSGYVQNDSSGVMIEVEGPRQALADFQRALCEETPPLARIVTLTAKCIPLRAETSFVILHSEAGSERRALIAPDTTTCDDCLRELFDPADRRYLYPFMNCTNCGPRFTIIEDVPYDRDKTTMRAFSMCPVCQREFDDPGNRRFHAQPNACPICGPHVTLLPLFPVGAGVPCSDIGSGGTVERHDAILEAARLLASGAIVAIKGLGGYHLACDALNTEAVERLRRRKQREARPFALMVPDVETARLLCHISDAEAQLLQARQRPIVLLRQRDHCPLAPAIAPDYLTLGIMLPYTPLHHVLLRAFSQISAPDRPIVLVMTSGNVSEEPHCLPG
ncbi:MAG TPA: Sua5/YciO/YrdC/YwlC family protein [Ktedonosporobacter sp.]|nr:Sua5/YciO/YrdC/YwlC family protein [Ktedonosporobacter sp.]